MHTIIRSKFADTPLDDGLLEDIAGLWLAWHGQAVKKSLFATRSYHRVQARVWGVPRPDMSAFQVLLNARLSREVAGTKVDLSDPDTLVLSTSWLDIDEPAALGRLTHVFCSDEFEGLALTLRLSAGTWRGTPDAQPPLKEGTLVISAEVRSGIARLKAVWPGDQTGRGETPFHFAPWTAEPEFWKTVEQFRKTGRVPRGANQLFISPVRHCLRHANRWLNHDVGEQRTLPAFLARAAFFAATSAVCLAAAFWGQSTWLGGLGLLFFGGLLVIVLKKARNVLAFYRAITSSLQRMYSQPQKYVTVDLQEAGPWPHASAGKYTRELEHLGLTHCRDFRGSAPTTFQAAIRLFVAPKERIYFFLYLMYATKSTQNFPVRAWFMSATFFSDGSRLYIVTEGGGYRKQLEPQVIARCAPGVNDPAKLLELHRDEVRRLLAGGKELAPLMSTDDLLARMEAQHERIRELTRGAGRYTIGAAIRERFRLIRREYRLGNGANLRKSE